MATCKIKPTILQGSIMIPPSKSMSHRAVLCAALASGTSRIDNLVLSDDIEATLRVCGQMGVEYRIQDSSQFPERKCVLVTGTGKLFAPAAPLDCCESGSTARFIIPITRLFEGRTVVTGRGRLTERPFQFYHDLLAPKGVVVESRDGMLPMTLTGRMQPGVFRLRGDVSSQFITGLLFALPLLQGDSEIEIVGVLESEPYVMMTMACLRDFGIRIQYRKEENRFRIAGGQTYVAHDTAVEGDWSQAAFWAVAGAISGGCDITGLSAFSLQGDKVIVDILRDMGASISFEQTTLTVKESLLSAADVDVSQCPDLVPAIAVACSLANGVSRIGNAARLRIKESDRLASVAEQLGRLGAKITEEPDALSITGVNAFHRASVDGCGDHRIVMALAVASSAATGPVEIDGAEAVSKSYPDFWTDFVRMGGSLT